MASEQVIRDPSVQANAHSEAETISTVEVPRCVVCQSKGDVLYDGLRDRLFSAPGVWRLRECQDPECGTLWLDPRAADADIPKLYLEYFTHSDPPRPRRFWRSLRTAVRSHDLGYAGPGGALRKRIFLFLAMLIPGKREQANMEVFFLPATSVGRLLDIGCGAGTALATLKELGWSVEGIDPDAAAVQTASARGLDVSKGDFATLSIPSEKFDVVVSSHVIEHVPDPVAFLGECHRVLKPGGKMIHITPNAASALSRRFGSHYLHLDPPRHLNLFSPAGLRRIAESQNFLVTRVISSFANSHVGWIASREIERSGRTDVTRRLSIGLRLLARVQVIWISSTRGKSLLAGDELIIECKKKSVT